MSGQWRKSPYFTLLVVAVLIITAASFFFRSKSKLSEDQIFDLRIKESVGMAAAEEAAKVLGNSGGSVALIFLNEGAPGAQRPGEVSGSTNQAYLKGFKEALAKLPAVHLAGPFPADKPLTLKTLQAVREKFADAKLFVSFIGLPKFEEGKETQWQNASPPKMIVVENSSTQPTGLEQLFQLELVQAVITFKKGIPYPEKKPTDLHKIFELFYEVHKPA